MIIKDKILGDNFVIEVNQDTFELKEKRVTETGKNVGSEYQVSHGYFTTLAGALRKAAHLLAIEGDNEMTILEYISTYQSIYEKLKKLVGDE